MPAGCLLACKTSNLLSLSLSSPPSPTKGWCRSMTKIARFFSLSPLLSHPGPNLKDERQSLQTKGSTPIKPHLPVVSFFPSTIPGAELWFFTWHEVEKRKHVRAVGMYLRWGRQAMFPRAEWGRRRIPREPNSHISRDWRLPTLPKKAAGLARPSVSDFNGSAGRPRLVAGAPFRDGSALWRFRESQANKTPAGGRGQGRPRNTSVPPLSPGGLHIPAPSPGQAVGQVRD